MNYILSTAICGVFGLRSLLATEVLLHRSTDTSTSREMLPNRSVLIKWATNSLRSPTNRTISCIDTSAPVLRLS